MLRALGPRFLVSLDPDCRGCPEIPRGPLIKEYTLNLNIKAPLVFKVYSLIKGVLGSMGETPDVLEAEIVLVELDQSVTHRRRC